MTAVERNAFPNNAVMAFTPAETLPDSFFVVTLSLFLSATKSPTLQEVHQQNSSRPIIRLCILVNEECQQQSHEGLRHTSDV